MVMTLQSHIMKPAVKSVCKLCGVTSSSVSNLNTHMILVHTEEALKKFECSLCGKKTARRCDLKFHSKVHITQPKGLFKCKFCQSPFLFPSKLQLDKHIQSTHGKHFATKANRFSKRVCRLCHRMLEEQEKQCKDCKSRIETFANGQSTSSHVSINPLILAILTLIIVILAFLIHQY